MSGELLGLALILPFDVERAAYLTHGVRRDDELAGALAREIEATAAGAAPLDSALVMGNPRRGDAGRFERELLALWARLRPGGVLVVGVETLAGRARAGRRGALGVSRLRRATRAIAEVPRRTWHAYPSLTRPTVLATQAADRDLRARALDQAGLRDGLASRLVSRGQTRIVAASSVPALLWEFRK